MQAEMTGVPPVDPGLLAPKQPEVENTPSNPQLLPGDQQTEEQGLTDEDWNILVNDITLAYRSQWSTDRILRMPRWLKATEFDKGNQNLSWDPVSKTYFDAIAWYRQNGGGEDVTYLEKYDNNITRMLRKSYVASVARGVPPVVVRPENAENLNDSTTAKAAQQAIAIIGRMNRDFAMTRNMAMKLYLYGCCFRRTRFVMDGVWAGYRNVPVPGEKQVVFPGHFHCKNCGTNTSESQAAQNCECGTEFTAGSYYPPEGATIPTMTMTEQERGMVKWTLYSPLQVDTDPTAKTLSQVPLLALDMEVDVADLRATFPEDADKIMEGMQSSTDPNNSYARLVRTKTYSQAGETTTDPMNSRSTFTQVWIQPRSYYKTQNKAFIAKMQRLFPKGVKLSMTGDVRLKAEPAELLKEWTHVGLDEEYGLYAPSIAEVVVPFNERFNNSENTTDDWFERCAAGMVAFDPNSIDGQQIDGKQMQPGVMMGLPTIGSGQGRPLADSLFQFNWRFEASMFTYQDRLMSLCQLLACISPQVFGGGTQEGVETAKGQKQMLDQALGILGVDWSLIKEETAAASQLAIECLIRNKELCGDIWDVIEERGSEFRNNYVHLSELQGKVRVYEQVDEGLPLTAEAKRAWWQHALDEAGKENPVYQAMMDDPTNQETAAAATGVQDLVVPKAAARSKTLQDIYKLFQQKPVPEMDPRTNTQAKGPDGELLWTPSFAPEKWIENYGVLKDTMLEYGQENCDLKQSQPLGWQNFIAYFRLACQYEVEVESFHAGNKLKIQQAGQPQPPAPPPPDPNVAAAKAELLAVAKREVDRLADLSQLPPLGKNQSIAGQVSAGKELIDTAVKLASDRPQ